VCVCVCVCVLLEIISTDLDERLILYSELVKYCRKFVI